MLCRSGGGVRSNTGFQIFSALSGTSAGARSPDPGRERAAPGGLNGDVNGFRRPCTGLPRPIRRGVPGELRPLEPNFVLTGVAVERDSNVFVVGRSGARAGVLWPAGVVEGSSLNMARARAKFAGLGWGALRPVPSTKPDVGSGLSGPGVGSSNTARAAAWFTAAGSGVVWPIPNVDAAPG